MLAFNHHTVTSVEVNYDDVSVLLLFLLANVSEFRMQFMRFFRTQIIVVFIDFVEVVLYECRFHVLDVIPARVSAIEE